jgi:hypothetical protein
MSYTHYNTDERNALKAMEGMGLPKSFMAVIVLLLLNLDFLESSYKVGQASWFSQNARRLIYAV